MHSTREPGPGRIPLVMRLRPGAESEYRARHQTDWPQLLTQLKTAGARYDSIYQDVDELLRYLEVRDFGDFVATMRDSSGNDRWQREMARLVDPCIHQQTRFYRRLVEVSHLD